MEFITDRTKADVLLGNAKGGYGYEDLNRVETAVAELSTLLGLNLTTKTDWSVSSLPLAADMDRYLGNVAAIRTKAISLGASSVFPALPSSMVNLNWTGANNIERVLELAYGCIKPGSELGVFVLGKSTLGGV